MKIELRTGCLLAGLLFCASCASPTVRRLDQPLTERPETAVLLDAGKLTGGTRSVLEEHGLAATYRRNPAETISRLRDDLPPDELGAQRLAVAELCSDTGSDLSESEPRKAVGYFLAAAELTFEDALESAAGKADSPSAAIYNHSSGWVAKLLFDLGHARGQTTTFKGPWKTYRLQCRAEDKSFSTDYFDSLESADYVELKNYEMERVCRQGIGAAMAGHRKGTPERLEENPFLSPIGMSVPVNALLDFQGGGEVTLELTDLLLKETAIVRGRSVPLAADLTLPLAVQVDYDVDRGKGFRAMLHPDDYVGHTGLYLLEPFRPDQIPVVFVHGLMSSPEIWVDALNSIRADPVLRQKYQLLVFRYPSGFPIIYNVATLRMQLAAFQKQFDPGRRNPNMRQMVLVGHSMGGVLSNAQIRGSGDVFTNDLFDRPIDQIEGLDKQQADALKDLLIYDPNPDVSRVIFVAAPHRGAAMAENFIGSFGRALMKLPREMILLTPLGEIGEMTDQGKEIIASRPDSIGSLKFDSPVLQGILENPIRSGVPVHSIIARNKPKQPLEQSGDTMVPYPSAHLEEAKSEIVVDSATHHTVYKRPEALEEIRRILYLHAGLGKPR